MRSLLLWGLGFITGISVGVLVTKLYVMEYFVLIPVQHGHYLVF